MIFWQLHPSITKSEKKESVKKLIIDGKALSSTWPELGTFHADNCYPGCSWWAGEDFPQRSQLILECNELPASQTATKTSSSIQRALNPAPPLWNIRSSAAIQPPFYLSGYAPGHANVHIVPSFPFSLTTADIKRMHNAAGLRNSSALRPGSLHTELRQHDGEYQI